MGGEGVHKSVDTQIDFSCNVACDVEKIEIAPCDDQWDVACDIAKSRYKFYFCNLTHDESDRVRATSHGCFTAGSSFCDIACKLCMKN